MSDGKTWVSSADYSGPGKWEDVAKAQQSAGRPAKRAKKPAKPRKTENPVTVTRADPKVLREALRLAEGDASRLTIERDGSITINNTSRRQTGEHA